MRERRDVISELQAAMRDQMRPGTSDSNINTFDLKVEVTRGLLQMAINEINQLRAIAGVVDALHKTSFREIKDEINGAPV